MAITSRTGGTVASKKVRGAPAHRSKLMPGLFTLLVTLVMGSPSVQALQNDELGTVTVYGCRGVGVTDSWGNYTCVSSAGFDSGGGGYHGGADLGMVGGGGNPPTEAKVAKDETTDPKDCDHAKAATPAQSSSLAMTNRPVLVATGTKILPETDFLLPPEEFPLKLTRLYNKDLTRIGVFGARWSSNIEHSLTFEYGGTIMCGGRLDQAVACSTGGNPMTAIHANGEGGFAVKLISNGAGQWTGSNGFVVTQNGSQWILTSPDGGTEVYDTYGRPVTIKNERGVGLTYTYDGSGRLATITHSTGRAISFTWSGSKVVAITAPNGKSYGYGYNANGYLASVVYPDNLGTKTYYYEDGAQPGGLTGIAINGLRYSRYAYQADGKVAWSGLEGGVERSTFSYASNATDVTNALGQTTHYDIQVINGERKIMAVTRPVTGTCAQGITETFYNANGDVDHTIDGLGVKTTYSYDTDQRLIQKIEGIGPNGELDQQLITDYDWDAVKKTRLNGVRLYSGSNADYIKQSIFTYYQDGDARARLLASVSEVNRSVTGLANQTLTIGYNYTIQASGLIGTMTVDGPISGTGDASTYTYDSAGNLIAVADSLGNSATYSNYNALGQPGHVVTANGGITDYTYNARGQILTETHTINGAAYTTTIGYDNRGRQEYVATPDGEALQYSYDAYDRITSVFREHPVDYGNPAITDEVEVENRDFTYNLLSQVLTDTVNFHDRGYQSDDPNGGGPGGGFDNVWTQLNTIYEYDAGGFLSKRKGNNGQAVTYSYNANGDLTSETDALGHATSYGYDRHRRVNHVQDAAGGHTWTTYKPQGTIDHVTDPRGLTTGYAYDGLGALWAQVSPDTGTTTFAYNNDGLKTSMIRNDGSSLNYSYDALGRLTSYGNANETRWIKYSGCAHGDGNGKGILPCGIAGSNNTWSQFTYTNEGQLAQRRDSVAGSNDLTAYSYDGMGRLVGVQYPSGVAVGYGFFGGHHTTTTATVNGVTTTVATMSRFQAFGPPTSMLYANHVVREIAYDMDGRLTTASIYRTSGYVESLVYGYDAADRMTSITDSISSARTQQYNYDAIARLTSEAVPGNAGAYAYDATGNRTNRQQNGLQYASYTYDGASNKLQSMLQGGTQTRTFAHNSIGDIVSYPAAVSGVSKSFTYDAFERLASHTSSGVTTNYTVNALNQRVAKGNPTSSSRYIYSGFSQLLAENTNGVWSSYIWNEGEPVAMVRGTQIYYIQADHVGRPSLVTDSSSATVWRASNSAFDRTVTQDGIGGLNLGFPGQYYDVESGLWHNGYRDYIPELGRYLQSDPIGLMGGANTYAYAGGNPVTSVDSSGLLTVRAYVSRAAGRGNEWKFEFDFNPLSLKNAPGWGGKIKKAIDKIGAMIEFTKPDGAGPLHPKKDYIECGALDAKLEAEYAAAGYESNQQLSRTQAEALLSSMFQAHPEMFQLYGNPGSMLDSATDQGMTSVVNRWFDQSHPGELK